MDTILKAVYELKRQELLFAKFDRPTSKVIPDAVAFAYKHRLCPILHVSHNPDLGQENPFEDAYQISRQFAKTALDYCDEKWKNNRAVTFYELEEFFHGNRHEIHTVLRYAALSGRFDYYFFRQLESDGPVEARGLNAPFKPAEISLY